MILPENFVRNKWKKIEQQKKTKIETRKSHKTLKIWSREKMEKIMEIETRKALELVQNSLNITSNRQENQEIITIWWKIS